MNYFEQELGYIKNDTIREFAKKAIESFPEYFWSIPASSTGKYHPMFATGQGGLYRHTRAAIGIAVELFRLDMFKYFSEDEKDLIIVALICHDAYKSGITQEKFTKHEHPLLAVGALKENLELKNIISEKNFNLILSGISSHMGQWASNEYSGIILPIPTTKFQNFIHMVDYLASRKNLEYNFDYIPKRD